MNKFLRKDGYISIEVVVVAGIILLAGLIAVSKFVSTGKNATKQSTDKINETLTNASQTNYDAPTNDDSNNNGNNNNNNNGGGNSNSGGGSNGGQISFDVPDFPS